MAKRVINDIESNIHNKIQRVLAASDVTGGGTIEDDDYWNEWDLHSNSDDELEYLSDNDEETSSFPESQEAPTDETDEIFQVRLAAWCVGSATGRDDMDNLLRLLRPKYKLPKSTKTLLHTSSHKIHPKQMANGAYYHFGIEKMLIDSEYPLLREASEIEIQISTDGYKVTRDEIVKQFSINNFVGDTPAWSFCAGRRGHTCSNGCHMCTQIAIKINNRLTFETTKRTARTDADFLMRSDPDHHLPQYLDSPTGLEMAGFGMFSQFPLGPLHLFDLGVTKKYLKLLLLNHCHGFHLTVAERGKLETKLLSFTSLVPREFARKPRTLKEFARWKATEFRQFVLYLSVVALRDCVSDEIYVHFMHLTCAYRLISTSDAQQNSEAANSLLERFVENYGIVFGDDRITPNVQNLLHICECVDRYGEVNNNSRILCRS